MSIPQQLTELTDKVNGAILFEVINGFLLFIVIVMEITAVFGRKELRRHLVEVNQGRKDVWDLLTIVKGWADSARVHSKEAALSAKAAPMVEQHVIAEVRKNPELTAEKVVERIKEDSDPFKKGLPPPTVSQ